MIDWWWPFDLVARLYRSLPVSVRRFHRVVCVCVVPVGWRNWWYDAVLFAADWRLWRRRLAREWASMPESERREVAWWENQRIRDWSGHRVFVLAGREHPCWLEDRLAGRRWMFPVSMGLLRVDGSMADRRAVRRWVVRKTVP